MEYIFKNASNDIPTIANRVAFLSFISVCFSYTMQQNNIQTHKKANFTRLI